MAYSQKVALEQEAEELLQALVELTSEPTHNKSIQIRKIQTNKTKILNRERGKLTGVEADC